MTLPEARALVKSEPDRFRAAFVEAPGTPLLDHPEARVRLHPTVGAAYDELRSRKESLVKDGWTVERGSLGKSVIVLGKRGERRVIGIDKRTARRGQSSLPV